jgi:LmbE family N-acetylglucosaminyl deacetylase
MARDQGAETSVLCLTAGAAGSYRPEGLSDEALAEIRRAEFAAACEALGVHRHTLLDYPDGALYQEPFLPLVGCLVEHLRRTRPHVVLTFGPDGGVNLHRDHTMVSLATTAAFHWAGRSGFFAEQLMEIEPWAPQKLYYSCSPFISTRDEEAAAAAALVPVTLRLDVRRYKEEKLAAFRKHSTQAGVLERVQAEHGDIFDEETYHLAAARMQETENSGLFVNVVGG